MPVDDSQGDSNALNIEPTWPTGNTPQRRACDSATHSWPELIRKRSSRAMGDEVSNKDHEHRMTPAGVDGQLTAGRRLAQAGGQVSAMASGRSGRRFATCPMRTDDARSDRA
jgi:hypothetical protein